jgi:hypothetical protein
MKNVLKKAETLLNLDNYRLVVDSLSERYVIGWARVNDDHNAEVVIEISSSSKKSYITANGYRPDVLRLKQHGTGRCGFKVDISDWQDKNVSVQVLGLAGINKKPKSHAPLFFIHLPKTGGTSFKKAAESYFGSDGLVKNYGVESVETTAWLKEKIYRDKDYYGFYQRLKTDTTQLYIGHVHAQPACYAFPIHQLVTIMRDPVKQVLSHFNHFKRWNNYQGSITDFINSKVFINLQSRCLENVPANLIGFVGITEDYNQSLALFNKLYQLDLAPLQENISQEKSVEVVDDSVIALIEKNNQADIKLYQQVKTIQQQRLALSQANKPWCYGGIQQKDKQHVFGYACWFDNDSPVVLQLMNGEQLLHEAVANQHKPGLVCLQVPRNSFIGFSFKLKGNEDLSQLKVVVKNTGQCLLPSM